MNINDYFTSINNAYITNTTNMDISAASTMYQRTVGIILLHTLQVVSVVLFIYTHVTLTKNNTKEVVNKDLYSDVYEVEDENITNKCNITACFLMCWCIGFWYSVPMPLNIFIFIPGFMIGYGLQCPLDLAHGRRFHFKGCVHSVCLVTVGIVLIVLLPWDWFVVDQCPCIRTYAGPNCDIPCHTNCSHTSSHIVLNGLCVCDCPIGFSGTYCQQKCPSTYINGECNNRGNCPGDHNTSGICECFSGYGGSACESICPVNRGYTCNGHGVCSSGGTCACSGGYMGSRCTECTSISSCSGHGQCFDWGCACMSGWKDTTLKKCAICTDAYKHPYDQNRQEQKQICSPCPQTTLGVCSGRGYCSASADTPMRVSCHCSGNYSGLSCEHICPQYNNKVCGGRGNCLDDGTCQCLDNIKIIQGQLPNNTKSSVFKPLNSTHHKEVHKFRGNSCNVICPDCSDRGFCNNNGKCQCDYGYTGVRCEQQCPPCGDGGTCELSSVPNATSGICICTNPSKWGPLCHRSCTCSSHGYCRNGMDTKEDPLRAYDEFTSPPCVAKIDNSKRNEHNSVKNINGEWEQWRECSNIGGCACEYGWAGGTCNLPCPSTQGGGICNSKGRCNANGQCICDSGFSGNECEKCDNNSACLNNGTCSATKTCQCMPGFAGPDCGQCSIPTFEYNTNPETMRCKQCKTWYYGKKCENKCPCDITQGICSDGVHGSGKCTACRPGFYGPNCTGTCGGITVHNGTTVGCYDNGICADSGTIRNVSTSGTCTCYNTTKYALPNCTECECSTHANCTYGAKCVCHDGWWGPNCYGKCPTCMHGSCTTAGTCQCNPGYWGVLCKRKCATSIEDTICSGRGTCTSVGTCKCSVGYTGEGCYYATSVLNP